MKRTGMLRLVTIIMLLLLGTAAFADSRNPFVEVVKAIRGSVVNIQVEYETSAGNINGFPMEDEFFKFFFSAAAKTDTQPESQIHGYRIYL